MINNKISVITVTYNCAEFIEETILSVINQTHSSKELIIIDGGSIDGTLNIIKRYADEITYWISEPDKGIYDAMNKGTRIATGDWINFMNSGDRFASPDVLSEVNKVLSHVNSDIDILYGEALIRYPNFFAPFSIHPLNTIWKNSPFCHQASFIKASLIKEWTYNTMYKIGADHDFFYRAYKNNKLFLRLDRLICHFDGRDGTTKKGIIQATRDKKEIALKYDYSVWKWIYYQFILIYMHIIVFIKGIMGKKLTTLITRIIRKPKY